MRGSCLCGEVSYQITGPFKVMGNCHCSNCRKSHGAAFVTWGIIDPDQFRWISGEELVQGYESSPGRKRCFLQEVRVRARQHPFRIRRRSRGGNDRR